MDTTATRTRFGIRLKYVDINDLQMIAHLTDEQIRLYNCRQLSGAERLDASEHMRGCDRCRTRIFQEQKPPLDVAELLQFMEDEYEHIIYDDLADYVDGRLPDRDRNRILEHLAECHCCAAETDALKRLKGEIAAPKREKRTSLWLWPVFDQHRYLLTGFAIASVLVIVVGIVRPRYPWGAGDGLPGHISTSVRPKTGRTARPTTGIEGDQTVVPKVSATVNGRTAAQTGLSSGRKRSTSVTAVLAVVLAPGVIRGHEQRSFSLSADSDVQFSLQTSLEVEPGTYHVTVRDDGGFILSAASRQIVVRRAAHDVNVTIPSRYFGIGRYVITLWRIEGSLEEAVDDYSFQVHHP